VPFAQVVISAAQSGGGGIDTIENAVTTICFREP
jgi:hypothetical protein